MSDFLAGILIPLCVWGLISTLILHLIDLRSVFIAGGEGKLRLATLAFAAGVILIERLSYLEGKALAGSYMAGLGLTIVLFSGYHANAYRIGVHPFIVFFVNLLIYTALWWVGTRISAACSVNSDADVETAAESGILNASFFKAFQRKKETQKKEDPLEAPPAKVPEPATEPASSAPNSAAPPDQLNTDTFFKDLYEYRHQTADDAKSVKEKRRLEKLEKLWEQKMTRVHPGRVILYFSLFALPAFGLGLLLFRDADPARLRLGLLLFFYLWCALSLLYLSSLRQLNAYFAKRELSLPDLIGLTWLALGFVSVSLILGLAFLLPQPPSFANLAVRQQLVAAYRGWEKKQGLPDSAKGQQPGINQQSQNETSRPGGEQDGRNGGGEEMSQRERVEGQFKERYADVDKMNDPLLSDAVRNTGAEPEFRKAVQAAAAVNDRFNKLMLATIRIIMVLALLALIFIVIIVLAVFAGRFREALGGLRLLKRGASKEKQKKGLLEDEKLTQFQQFRQFENPFLRAGGDLDGNQLVRYTWQALLAWCADRGHPCAESQTPLEFIESNRMLLQNLEQSALWLAGLYGFSEFSGQPVPPDTLPRLQQFWQDLR